LDDCCDCDCDDCCPFFIFTVVVVIILAAIIVPTVVVLTRKKKNVNANVPANVPSDISQSGGIEHCPGGSPGNAVACSFEPDATLHATNYTLSIVGTPQGNCYGNTSTSFTIGGKAIITQQWSVSYNTGARFPFLNVGGEFGWSSQNTYEVSQSTTIQVSAGDQVALVLKVQNTVTTGRMLVHFSRQVNGSNYWYVNNVSSYQPDNHPIYDAFHLPCGKNFDLPFAPLRIPQHLPNNGLQNQDHVSVVFFIVFVIGLIFGH